MITVYFAFFSFSFVNLILFFVHHYRFSCIPNKMIDEIGEETFSGKNKMKADIICFSKNGNEFSTISRKQTSNVTEVR